MTSLKRQIFDAMEAQLKARLPWAKTVNWQRIRVLSSDFADHEIPVIQFYHIRTDYEHQQGKVEGRMRIAVELVIKSNATASADQRDLFDKMEEIEQAIGSNPNFGVPGVIHARYLSDESDVHTLDPFFLGVLTFEVLHRKTFTGC